MRIGRIAGLLLASTLTLACVEEAGEGPASDDSLGVSAEWKERAGRELTFARAALPSYQDTPYAADMAQNMNKARALCSLVIVEALDARERGEAPGPLAAARMADLARAIDTRESPMSTPSDPPWVNDNDAWLAASAGVDCLLAAGLTWSVLDADTRRDLGEGLHDLAQKLYLGPIPYRGGELPDLSRKTYIALQRENRGDTRLEEAAIAGSFFVLAHDLLPGSVSEWRTLGEDLLAYAVEQGDDAPFAPGESLAPNHQMSPSTYYTVGGLLPYAAVAAALRHLHPDKAGDAPPAFLQGARILEILAAADPLTTEDFRYKGSFELLRTDGAPPVTHDPESGAPYSYDALTHTIPGVYPPGSELLAPTSGVDALCEYRHPSGEMWGYQLNGTEVRAYRCRPSPGATDGRIDCDARFKHSLAEQMTGLVDKWNPPLPTDQGVDAWPQYVGTDGRIRGTVFIGDRTWRYSCGGGACTAEATRSLSEYLGRFQKVSDFEGWSSLPSGRLRAATIVQQSDGLLRYYLYSDTEVWAARCQGNEDTGCVQFFQTTIEGQFAQLDAQFTNLPSGDCDGTACVALPDNNVDAITQYESRPGWLATHVVQGDRIWEYECDINAPGGPQCHARFVRSLHDHLGRIQHQERWLRPGEEYAVAAGVSDWGVDATMMNAIYTLGALLGGDRDVERYDALLEEQSARGRDARPMWPSRYDEGAGWSDGLFDGLRDANILDYLGDGWRPFDGRTFNTQSKTLSSRLNSHWWMNLYAARNHAIAHLLVEEPRPLGGAEPPLLERLVP